MNIYLPEFVKIHGIMHGNHLLWIYSVLIYDNIPGKIAHCNHLVGFQHAHTLYVVDLAVHILAAPVEFGRMDVNHQRFSGNTLCRYSRSIGKPVMRMNHVKGVFTSNSSRHHGIIGNLLHKVYAIFAGKSVLAAIFYLKLLILRFCHYRTCIF